MASVRNDTATGERRRLTPELAVRSTNGLIVVVALIVALLFPLLVDEALVGVGFVALVYAYRNFTWNIAGGFAGLLSLAHGAAFGVGAFAVAVLTWTHGYNAWLALVAGVVASALLGFGISLLMSRFGVVNPFFFALSTLAVTLILAGIAASWDVLGSANGLRYTGLESGFLHLQWFLDPLPFYYLTLVLLIIVTAGVAAMLKFTHFGRSLAFIREDPVMAASMGIRVVRNQAYVMALSMGLTAIAGTLLAQYIQFASYDSVLTVEIAVAMVVGTIIGGSGTLAGPIVAGIGLAALEEFLRSFEVSSTNVSSYTQIMYGVLVILLLRFGTDGLVPLWNSGLRRLFSRLGGDRDGASRSQPPPAHSDDAGVLSSQMGGA
jgi:branched-chain amino acid transport system permease protein